MRRGALLFAGAAAGLGALAAARAVRRPRYDFAGRTALVTGGSRGLGLVLARELAREGADLVLLARDEAELKIARNELEAGGARVLAVTADVGDRQDAARAVSAAMDRFGRLDVLVNNAGIIQVGPLEHMTFEDFEEAMAVHFRGPLSLVLEALPHLRRSGDARIVNVASIGGKIAVPHMLPYCASKFALVGLSDGLRAELAKDGIRVTTVCPGLMRTGSHLRAQFKGRREEEFAWFAVSDANPLASMNARRAARKILEACRRGDPSLILTLQAKAAVAGAHLAPGLTARAMKLADRLLPEPAPEGGDTAEPGWKHPSRWAPSPLTSLADRAAVRNNERPAVDTRRA